MACDLNRRELEISQSMNHIRVKMFVEYSTRCSITAGL